jgi:hypothetical protein
MRRLKIYFGTLLNWLGSSFASSMFTSPLSHLAMSVNKKIAAVLFLVLSLSVATLAQNQAPNPEMVKVSFRNNSIVFRKVTLVTYLPTETGNGTRGIVMAPYASTSESYPVGTKIYFANRRQVAVVMSGKPLSDEPFLVVKPEHEGKTFSIFK